MKLPDSYDISIVSRRTRNCCFSSILFFSPGWRFSFWPSAAQVGGQKMTHGPCVPAAQHPEAAGAVQRLAGEQRKQPRWFHSAFGMNCLQVNFTNPLRRKKIHIDTRKLFWGIMHHPSCFITYRKQRLMEGKTGRELGSPTLYSLLCHWAG